MKDIIWFAFLLPIVKTSGYLTPSQTALHDFIAKLDRIERSGIDRMYSRKILTRFFILEN